MTHHGVEQGKLVKSIHLLDLSQQLVKWQANFLLVLILHIQIDPLITFSITELHYLSGFLHQEFCQNHLTV